MKKCPQCNSVYADNVLYCLSDGTVLIDENLSLPSQLSPFEEEETVIRNEPIGIDPPQAKWPTEQFDYQAPPTKTIIPIIVKKERNTGSYLAFLLIGSLLGGGLVLATLLLTRNFYRNDDSASAARSDKHVKAAPDENQNSVSSATINQKHLARTAAGDDAFNGRVIVTNANVRAGPDRNASDIDTLPLADRLDIENRESEDSPWFEVTCEHGTSGWMHGNTIEFIQ